jgi:phosphate uptake regulator
MAFALSGEDELKLARIREIVNRADCVILCLPEDAARVTVGRAIERTARTFAEAVRLATEALLDRKDELAIKSSDA